MVPNSFDKNHGSVELRKYPENERIYKDSQMHRKAIEVKSFTRHPGVRTGRALIFWARQKLNSLLGIMRCREGSMQCGNPSSAVNN